MDEQCHRPIVVYCVERMLHQLILSTLNWMCLVYIGCGAPLLALVLYGIDLHSLHYGRLK
jgi:hypothetical protein